MIALLFATVLAAGAPLPAVAQEVHAFNVSTQDPATAIQTFGAQAEIQILASADDLKGKKFNPVTGEIPTEQALNDLLKGTGLDHRYVGERAVALVSNTPAPAVAGNSTAYSSPPAAGSASNQAGSALLAQVGSTPSSNTSGGEQQLNPSSGKLTQTPDNNKFEEILVTAQKTGVAERLQDVPIPIAVISAQALMQSNQSQIQDYFDQIPGLSIAENGNGVSIVSIRGINTGGNNNPTVGFTLDDVPLGASTDAGAAGQIPSINPADLAQVEVLRGPQGTIYGDNSMGGLIRYVTVDPSTERVFGDVRVGGDSVFNGVNLGYNASAAVNVPLTDTIAIRASGFTRQDPGYVDNVETGERGEGLTKTGGGRVAAMWKPSSDFSLKFSLLYEKLDRYGAPDIAVPTAGYPQTTGLGDLQQYFMPQTGGSTQEFKTGNLTLNANLGGMKLTAISGYTVNGFVTSVDLSSTFAPPPPTTVGTPLLEDNQLHKFTQEVRLTDSIGSHLDWLLGGFYTQEDSRYIESLSTANLASGAIIRPGSIYYSDGPDRYTEYAGFGSLTWKIVDSFDVQFGARESYMATPALDVGSYSGGSLLSEAPGPSVYTPPSNSYWKANAFTYLVSPRFKLTPDIMVYARVATGFRPGSGTSNPPATEPCVTQQVPCLVRPDKTTDFEVGSKAELFDHVLSIDSSVYYIKWTDLQVNLTSANDINYSGNGAGAKSQGVDLSLAWKPLEGFTVSGWGAWNEAVVTQTFPEAAAGQPMPYSARFSANFSVEKDVPITDTVHAFFAGKEIYMGDRKGEFTSLGSARQDLPAYAQTNLNAGVKVDRWTASLYVNNATDRRGVLYGGLGSSAAPFTLDIITPRTIGLSVDRSF